MPGGRRTAGGFLKLADELTDEQWLRQNPRAVAHLFNNDPYYSQLADDFAETPDWKRWAGKYLAPRSDWAANQYVDKALGAFGDNEKAIRRLRQRAEGLPPQGEGAAATAASEGGGGLNTDLLGQLGFGGLGLLSLLGGSTGMGGLSLLAALFWPQIAKALGISSGPVNSTGTTADGTVSNADGSQEIVRPEVNSAAHDRQLEAIKADESLSPRQREDAIAQNQQHRNELAARLQKRNKPTLDGVLADVAAGKLAPEMLLPTLQEAEKSLKVKRDFTGMTNEQLLEAVQSPEGRAGLVDSIRDLQDLTDERSLMADGNDLISMGNFDGDADYDAVEQLATNLGATEGLSPVDAMFAVFPHNAVSVVPGVINSAYTRHNRPYNVFAPPTEPDIVNPEGMLGQMVADLQSDDPRVAREAQNSLASLVSAPGGRDQGFSPLGLIARGFNIVSTPGYKWFTGEGLENAKEQLSFAPKHPNYYHMDPKALAGQFQPDSPLYGVAVSRLADPSGVNQHYVSGVAPRYSGQMYTRDRVQRSPSSIPPGSPMYSLANARPADHSAANQQTTTTGAVPRPAATAPRTDMSYGPPKL